MDEQYWTTLDGTKIAVGDMSESHLRNTLRMIIRKSQEKKFIVSIIDEDTKPCGMEDWEIQFWEDEGRYGTSKT